MEQVKSTLQHITRQTWRLRLMPPSQPILLLAFLAPPQAAEPLHGAQRVVRSKLKLTMTFCITTEELKMIRTVSNGSHSISQMSKVAKKALWKVSSDSKLLSRSLRRKNGPIFIKERNSPPSTVGWKMYLHACKSTGEKENVALLQRRVFHFFSD